MVENKNVPTLIKKMWENFAKHKMNAMPKNPKKKKQKFKLLWNSTKNGTYVKNKHGELK